MALNTNIAGGSNYPGQVNKPQYITYRAGQPTTVTQPAAKATVKKESPERTGDSKYTYLLGDVEISQAEYERYNSLDERGKFEYQKAKGIIPADTKYITYKINDVELDEAQYNKYTSAKSPQRQFEIAKELGIIPNDAVYVPPLDEKTAAFVRQSIADGILDPNVVGDQTQARSWGYMPAATVEHYNNLIKSTQKAWSDYVAARQAAETSNAAATTVNQITFVRTPFLAPEQTSALDKLKNYQMYSDNYGIDYKPVSAISNVKGKEIVYNIDRYLIDNPGDTKPLRDLGIPDKEIDYAVSRSAKWLDAKKHFVGMIGPDQKGLIARYIGRKNIAFKDLTPGEQYEVIQKFLYSYEYGVISKQPDTYAEYYAGKNKTGDKNTSTGLYKMAALVTPVAVIEPTPAGEAVVAALLIAAGVATVSANVARIMTQAKEYKAQYGTSPTYAQIKLTMADGKDITLAEMANTVPKNTDTTLPPMTGTRIDTKTPGFVPARIETKLTPITGIRIDNKPTILVPKNIEVKTTPLVPARMDTSGMMLSWSSRDNTITRERTETLPINFPIGKPISRDLFGVKDTYDYGRTEGPYKSTDEALYSRHLLVPAKEHGGSAHLSAQSLPELDQAVYQAYSSGAMSLAEYKDYQKARIKYLKGKGAISESAEIDTGKIHFKKGKILTKDLVFIAVAAASQAAQEVMAQPQTRSLSETKVKTRVRTAAQIAAKEAIKTATQTQEASQAAEQTALHEATQAALELATQQATNTAMKTATMTATMTTTKAAEATETTSTAEATAVNTATMEATAVAEATATRRRLLQNAKSDKEKRKIIRKYRGAITWRQGQLQGKDRWIVIMPPYRTDADVVNVMGRVPKGAHLVTGARSAFKTATVTYGITPSAGISIFKGLGAFSVSITPQGRGVSLDYTPNISYRSPRITNRMPRLR